MGEVSAEQQELRITTSEMPGGVLVRLAGKIDTRFPREKLSELCQGVVVLDLDEVTRISSYGVREWSLTIKDLKSSYLGFTKCRPNLVMQFNMISTFAGKGELLSFYVPYVCPSCEKYTELLVDLREQHATIKAFTAPPLTCECGAQSELDDSPEAYFQFAAKAKVPAPPPLADALISGKPLSSPLHVDKDVSAEITAFWLTGSLQGTVRLRRIADGLEGTVILICDGISSIDERSLANLRPFLDAPDSQVYLARVPLPMIPILAAPGVALGRVGVLSVQLPFRCPPCQATTLREVDGPGLALLAGGSAGDRVCSKCYGKLIPAFEVGVVEQAQRLPFIVPSNEVRAYLVDHVGPPGKVEEKETGLAHTLGRYQLVRRLGTGGMAEVFLAKQTAVGGFEKRVVVKRILSHLAEDQEFVSMFLDEARLAVRISHPNVVQIFDVDQDKGQYFIAMEYVHGWDLNFVLNACKALNEPFPLQLAARVASDICAGLHAAHTCTDDDGKPLAIIHRDVSPHNVLVSVDGQVKISDFGIAKAADQSGRTPANTLKGKLAYMAPEQGRGEERIDCRADIFPAGLILYLCLTLEHMFERESDFATLQGILHDPIPRVQARFPHAPAALQEILDKALARDPNDRYPTAMAFKEALDRLIFDSDRHAADSKRNGASSSDLARWLAARLPPASERVGATPTGLNEGGTRTFVRTL